MNPVYVTQTTPAVTILHKIHYTIEVPKTKTDYWFSKYNRVMHHYFVSIAVVVVVVVAVVNSGSTPFPNYDGLQVLKTVKY